MRFFQSTLPTFHKRIWFNPSGALTIFGLFQQMPNPEWWYFMSRHRAVSWPGSWPFLGGVAFSWWWCSGRNNNTSPKAIALAPWKYTWTIIRQLQLLHHLKGILWVLSFIKICAAGNQANQAKQTCVVQCQYIWFLLHGLNVFFLRNVDICLLQIQQREHRLGLLKTC